MKLGIICTWMALAAFSQLGHAEVLSGRVVDANGIGVGGVNIDVQNPNGSDPTVSNGGTDPNGFFNVTIVPAGVYDVFFEPPPPPTTTHLVREMTGVVVVGTKTLGNVSLAPGVALSGRVLSPTGIGVAGVDLDVISAGSSVELRQDVTNALGQFNFASPAGDIELRFDSSGVPGTLAPDHAFLTLAGNTSIGTFQLRQGFVVSATVQRASNSSAVAGVDVDVSDSVTGVKLFTPGDDTNSLGFVDVVVPAGVYDIEFCPPFAARLVASEIPGRSVSATTSLGTQFLGAGVVLSGVVRDPSGQTVAGVDIDVRDSTTKQSVVLCNDNTNAQGLYAVVIPTGTFDLTYSPPLALPLGALTFTNWIISGDTTRNASLPACPFYTTSGSTIAGSGGLAPQISASGGAPRIGNASYSLELTGALGGAKAFSLVSYQRPSAPPFSPAFVALTGHQLGGAAGVPGAGTLSQPMPIPDNPAFAGVSLHARFFVIDPGAIHGKSVSHELTATICP